MPKTNLVNANSGKEPDSPSEVISHYLEAIYYMQAEGETVRSARLADWLAVSRPTVTVALRRMIRDGLVRIGARKEIQLTRKGDQAASAIVRRHRLMERWLHQVLGLDWVAADAEAARLEHAISERVERRLYEVLGRPSTCPHGNPIPGHATLDRREIRLSDLPGGRVAKLSRISEVAEREAPALLHYLQERGLVPSMSIKVLHFDEIGRTLHLRVGARDLTMSKETAAKIWVVPKNRSS